MADSTGKPTLTPTFVFVPFFGGSKAQLRRHFELIDSWGFPWEFVDLPFSLPKILFRPLASRGQNWGMKTLWADQIEVKLNSIPGPKIVFAFSNPTAAAIEAIARRNATDVLALIADSGPTSEVWNSILNYYKYEKPLPTWPAKALATTLSSFLMQPDFWNFCSKELEQFPKDFPILSIRGWKDALISPTQIDKIFEPHKHLRWQKLSLPEVGHLSGLKDSKEDYAAGILKFLASISVSPPRTDHPKSAQSDF